MAHYLYVVWKGVTWLTPSILTWRRNYELAPNDSLVPPPEEDKRDLENMDRVLMRAYRDIYMATKRVEIVYILNERYRRVSLERHFSSAHKNNTVYSLTDELFAMNSLESSYIMRNLYSYESLLVEIDQRAKYRVELPITIEREVYQRTSNHSMSRIKEKLAEILPKGPTLSILLDTSETQNICNNLLLVDAKRYLQFKLGKSLDVDTASMHDLASFLRIVRE